MLGGEELLAAKLLGRLGNCFRGGKNATSLGRKAPNPHGSKGKPDHQAKVDQLEAKARGEAGPNEQVLRERELQGHNSLRRPDVQIVDESGKARKVFEGERRPNSKRNRDREAEYDRLGLPCERTPVP